LTKVRISVVSPVFLAEGCIAELCGRLHAVLGGITTDYEIILVDDASPDGAWGVIVAQAKADSRVVGMRLVGNVGQHRAITAGLDIADGDWVIVMDCDLQDPPEAIPDLYAKAIEGHDVVVASFDERPGSRSRRAVSTIYWKGISWLAGMPFDPRVGNFRIMSRDVVIGFRRYRERARLLGGIVALMGYRPVEVTVRRDVRFHGSSSYSVRKLVSLGAEIALAYSDRPLRIAVAGGLAIAGAAFAVGVALILGALFGAFQVPGWASVIVSLYLLGGITIGILGVLGLYLGRTFDEAKGRPLYTVACTIRASS
jgi:glycosyltransferase involved in cell wall biosynthesis